MAFHSEKCVVIRSIRHKWAYSYETGNIRSHDVDYAYAEIVICISGWGSRNCVQNLNIKAHAYLRWAIIWVWNQDVLI